MHSDKGGENILNGDAKYMRTVLNILADVVLR